MAMDLNDLMALKDLGKGGFTPYEQVKVSHMQSKRASGTAIGALCVGVGAAVAAVGVGAYACAKASEARRSAAAENAGTAALLKQATEFMTNYMKEERQERRAETVNLTQTITDSISGQHQRTAKFFAHGHTAGRAFTGTAADVRPEHWRV